MEEKKKDGKIFTKEFLRTFIIALLFVAIIKLFVLEPFLVKGTSMEPSFQDNDYIFVESISDFFKSFQRGDVVIFQHPENQCDNYIKKHPIKNFIDRLPFLNFIPPISHCTNFIKRIIGLPGETVVVKDVKITIKSSENP